MVDFATEAIQADFRIIVDLSVLNLVVPNQEKTNRCSMHLIITQTYL